MKKESKDIKCSDECIYRTFSIDVIFLFLKLLNTKNVCLPGFCFAGKKTDIRFFLNTRQCIGL